MSRCIGLSFAVAAAVTIIGKTSAAQLPPPTPPPAAQPAPLWSPGAAPAQPAAATATVAAPAAPAAAAAVEEGGTDQEKVVGHMGIGYMGVSQIPIASGLTGGAGTVNAPVIGVRYWLKPNMGLDLGLGFGLQSGGAESTTAGVTASVDQPGVFGMAIHGGVPLVLSRGKHYAFEAIPELTVGFATSSIKGAPGQGDTSVSGSRIEIGGRIGAEIFFGFIGVPELSLQASVGLSLRRMAYKASQDTPTSTSSGASQMNIGTTVQADPWAIFANNISATYYF